YVVRREQEHLAGDAFDTATQTKDETSGEVDQPLGVDVRHIGQVHDDRYAITEVLAHDASLVIGAGMNSHDPRHIGRPWVRGESRTGGDCNRGRTPAFEGCHRGRFFWDAERLVCAVVL